MVNAKNFDLLIKDQKAESQNDQESTLAKYAREAYVFGGGTVGGAVKEGIGAVVERPRSTALQAAEGAAIGTALTLAKAGPLPVKLLGVAAGGYFTYTSALWLKNDVLSPDRWKQLGGVWSDTWRSSVNTDKNFNIVQGSLGRLTFDTALMVGSGAFGMKAGAIGKDIALAHTAPLKAVKPRPVVADRPVIAEKPVIADKPVVAEKTLPVMSANEILEGIGNRRLSSSEGLTTQELQAVAAVKSGRESVPYETTEALEQLEGKAGWQIAVVQKLHTKMFDETGALKPGMAERMETAWQLKDVVSENHAEDLLYHNGDQASIASIFIVDGVKDAQHLANYAKIHQPASMAFYTRPPNFAVGPYVAEFAQQPIIHELQRHEMANAFVNYVATGKVTTDAAAANAAHMTWYVDHTLPIELATEFSGKPIKDQLAAAAAWNLTLAERGVVREKGGILAVQDRAKVDWSDPSVREAHARNLRELQEKGRGAIVTNLGEYNALIARYVIETVHGDKLNKAQLEELSNAFVEEKANATRVIAAIKSTRFKEALDIVEKTDKHGVFNGKTALRLTVTFKGAAADWINGQAKLGRNTHDATYWLPIEEPVHLQGLDKFLFSNSTRQLPDLELTAGRWKDLSAAEKAMPFDDLVFKLRSESYPDAKSPQFAAESARWGTKQENYTKYESRFLASQEVPSPFPLEKKWESNGLVGRFLPRSDARGLYLGQHTNCCQHPKGQGSTAAWYGQESPKAGFFVVEDASHNIVAQSFAWVSETGGIVFDNVEAKGLGKRDPTVQKIYSNAANDLVRDYNVVTVGTGATDLNLSQWPQAKELTQTFGGDRNVYRDSDNQVVIAHKPGYVMPEMNFDRFGRPTFNLDVINRPITSLGGTFSGILPYPQAANQGFPFLNRRVVNEEL